MSLLTRPLCSFRHHWPYHLDHPPSLILVWYPWLFFLSWFKSYLSSRCFRVKCKTDLSSWYTSSCGVPQGSVLGPLLFVMYTTPLSTFIFSCSLNITSTHLTLSSFYPSFRLTSTPAPPSQCSRSNFVLDDCKSSYTELLQDWISVHWSQ